MFVALITYIITKTILSNNILEINEKFFCKIVLYYKKYIQKKSIIESCKGGWRMVYKDFDYVLISMKSPNEIRILLQIRDLFKASLSRVVINKATIDEDLVIMSIKCLKRVKLKWILKIF